MDPKSERPFRLFVNPLALWTDLAFKTGQAMWAAAARSGNAAAKVAVIPTADAPAPKAARSKAPRVKPRRKKKAKRRAKR